MDRRIKKTEDAIQLATLKLLKTTSMNKLSIKEICNEANVSRSTFYLHYASPVDVIEHLYVMVTNTLTKSLGHFDFSQVLSDSKPFLIEIFETVDEYLEQFSMLLQTNYHSNFRRRLRLILSSKILEDNSYRYQNSAGFKYSVIFIISGLVETICDNMQDVRDENKRQILLETLTKQISTGFSVQ